jgi:DNA-binding HxlR family transcriptional regulator
MDTQQDVVLTEVQEQEANADAIQPLISLASALLDTDRLRIVAVLVEKPANRMELSEATGIGHRDLLRQLDVLREHGLVRLVEPAPRQPDQYSLYELNVEAFRAARQAMGKYKGVKPRPSDSRLMTLETFMPGGKLNAMPLKQPQIVVILDEVARKFEPERQYAEREVNVILEEVHEDYCTLRRYLVDYGYLARDKGIYVKRDG